ncbi:MAG: hypothetical protein F4145_05360 [Boseongicola sp. SB0675_bin_26]|nr:hypothetical protein [Boseongicola sp. SB0675_bin_26]
MQFASRLGNLLTGDLGISNAGAIGRAGHQGRSRTRTALYEPGSDLAAQWGKVWRGQLDQGRLDLVIAELARHAERCRKAEGNMACFRTNRVRMDYPRFRERNLCVSTGVIQGACKSVIAGRLKRGGMHWSVDGANACIVQRCSVHRNRFDDFWERRAG